MNAHRSLSYEQRAFAAARLAETIKISSPELAGSREHLAHHHSLPILEAGKRMDVTPAAIKRAKAVLQYAPHMEEDVVKRRVSLTVAADQVRPKRAKKNGVAKVRVVARGLPVAARVPVIDTSKRRLLTPQEVDPEFTGTANDFTTKYGHVQVETAEERASNRFAEWTLHIRKWAKEFREFPLSPIDVGWLRSPRARDVDRFLEAYATLAVVFDNIQSVKDKVKKD